MAIGVYIYQTEITIETFSKDLVIHEIRLKPFEKSICILAFV